MTLPIAPGKIPGAIGRPELGEKPTCLPGHQRITKQEVWGSCAFALLPSSRSNLFGHGPLPPSPSASLFLVSFGRLLLLGWGLRNLALKSDVGASGFFNHPHSGILHLGSKPLRHHPEDLPQTGQLPEEKPQSLYFLVVEEWTE